LNIAIQIDPNDPEFHQQKALVLQLIQEIEQSYDPGTQRRTRKPNKQSRKIKLNHISNKSTELM